MFHEPDNTQTAAAETPPKPKKTGFRGTPNLKGRPKGIPHRHTMVLKEAILMAANNCGEDGRGKDGLLGFLIKEARKKNNTSFMILLGKVLPLTIAGDKNNPLVHHVKISLVRAEGSRPAPKIINAKPATGDEA